MQNTSMSKLKCIFGEDEEARKLYEKAYKTKLIKESMRKIWSLVIISEIN